MNSDDLEPYAMARQRFSHACRELKDEEQTINDRLLAAIVALSPMRAEDMPRSCQLHYERVKQSIGPGLWDNGALGGALASAVASLSSHHAAAAIEWIAMARDSLDEYCGVEQRRESI